MFYIVLRITYKIWYFYIEVTETYTNDMSTNRTPLIKTVYERGSKSGKRIIKIFLSN